MYSTLYVFIRNKKLGTVRKRKNTDLQAGICFGRESFGEGQRSCQYSCSIPDCVVPTAVCTPVLVIARALTSVHSSMYTVSHRRHHTPNTMNHHTGLNFELGLSN